MASPAKEVHFILIPLMAQGHMIPMVDFGRILAQRGAAVTIITTPINANRFKSVVARSSEAKLPIQMLEVQFSTTDPLIPEGCENLDILPANLHVNFFVATSMLEEPVEKVLLELKPTPICIISDMTLPWTMEVAQKLNIPRLVLRTSGCFPLLCMNKLLTSAILSNITSDSDPFVIPDLPDRIELTKAKLANLLTVSSTLTRDFYAKIGEAEKATYGIVVNTFQELEPEYAKEYEKAKGKKFWCIGPVSLCNKNNLDMAERGNKAAIDEHHCSKWLDLWEPSSVLYVCLGSLSRLSMPQMIDLGLALELSNRPFVWCIREKSDGFKRWLSEEKFEERVKERGLLIHGWAPQVLILSHQAIGGFVTHCGWNSTFEGVCSGVPMITWPHFAEQFLNEGFIVEVLKTGVRIGVEVPVFPGDEENMGVLVQKDDIKMAVENLMDGGGEGEGRRKRARELADMAKWAMEEGGSSHLYITQLIQDIMEKANEQNSA